MIGGRCWSGGCRDIGGGVAWAVFGHGAVGRAGWGGVLIVGSGPDGDYFARWRRERFGSGDDQRRVADVGADTRTAADHRAAADRRANGAARRCGDAWPGRREGDGGVSRGCLEAHGRVDLRCRQRRRIHGTDPRDAAGGGSAGELRDDGKVGGAEPRFAARDRRGRARVHQPHVRPCVVHRAVVRRGAALHRAACAGDRESQAH